MSLDHPLTHGRARTKRGAAKTPAGRTKRRAATTPRRGLRRRAVALVAGRARLLAALVVLAALLGGGWLWLRDSSLVRVEHVQVTGVTSSAEPRIDAALAAAARGMTTLDVDQQALRRSVAGFPSVAGLAVHTDFPHGMTIEVVERRPVAAIVAGRERIAVTGSGRLLRDVQDTIGLPAIAAPTPPAGDAVDAPRTRAQLAVAAAAPPVLRRRAQDVVYGAHGLQVDLVDGPPLYFGTADHAAAKWAAAARVMSSPSAAGATYLDLRIPGRVAAGGLDPVLAEDPQDDAVDPTAVATATPAATATPIATATPTPTPTPYSQP